MNKKNNKGPVPRKHLSAGQRMTQQRRVILEALRRVRTHPTADELYAVVRKALPKISLGTVYRNLEVLRRDGQVLRLEECGGKMRFDGATGGHYHVRCLICGAVADVEIGCGGKSLSKAVKDAAGYEILDHRLEFVGRCPKCRRGNRKR